MAEQLFSLVNDGPLVKWTDFWDHPIAARGLILASPNAGVLRLLVPDANAVSVLAEMRTGKRAEMVEAADEAARAAGGVDIVFDDGSEAPYFIGLALPQFLGVPQVKPGDVVPLHVWTRQGRQLQLACTIVNAPVVPEQSQESDGSST